MINKYAYFIQSMQKNISEYQHDKIITCIKVKSGL